MLGSLVAGEGIRRRAEAQLEIFDVDPSWVVSSASACGVTNGYDHPNRLGVDRWVALIGARHRLLARGTPRPALVVMVGTAVTIDALDGSGRFLGGLILPGFGLMLRALEMGTAGLKAPTGETVDFPTNTSDALMSGGSDAIAGAVERMHRKLQRHTGEEPVLIMSGGASVKLAFDHRAACRDGRHPDLRRPAAAAGEAAGALGSEGRTQRGPLHRRNDLETRRREPRGLRRPPLQPPPSPALRRRRRGAGARRRRMSCRCPIPTRTRSIRRRPSSPRCRAATCCGSCDLAARAGWLRRPLRRCGDRRDAQERGRQDGDDGR